MTHLLPNLPAAQETRLREALAALVAATLEARTTEEFLHELLAVAAQLADADFAAASTCEGHRLLWPHTGNFDGFDQSALWSALDQDPVTAMRDAVEPARGPSITARNADGIAPKAIRLQRWTLYDGTAPVAAVCLGMYDDHELSDADAQLLAFLSPKAGRALSRQLERERLERAIRARDAVLATVAHELRNPVNVVTISANQLMRRTTDPAARRPLERIVRGAQRAERLIQDLLDVNAIEKGRFSVDVQSVDIAELVLSAQGSQQSLAAAASIILAIDLTPDLPRVRCDQERILEVLENLIGNAMKFTRPGGTITLGASLCVDGALVSVRDTGCGVPPEHIPHLFERFWQGDPADRRGVGLGLALCKAIVDAHGGRIWAESSLGEGTFIYFTIPAERRERPRSMQPARVLIVDDRPENLVAMRAILDLPQYAVRTASSGQEALHLALKERFSVALIDVQMPEMSGIEVARLMKQVERTRDIPIIFVTAFGNDPHEIHRAYDAGCADYLIKPLDPEIVRRKVALFAELSLNRQSPKAPRT